MGIVKSFERNFLFSAGRHLSNIFSFGGLITVLTAGFLFMNSTILKTPKTINEYSEKLRNEVKTLQGELKDESSSINRSDEEWSIRANKLEKLYEKEKELKNVAEGYENYVLGIRFRNQGKREQGAIAPFVFGYGLVAIASAATSSAVFSIERSSRKD